RGASLFGISTRSQLVVLHHWEEREIPLLATVLYEGWAGEGEEALLGMAELGEQASVVCSIDAVRETSKALFAVHGHLDQEARKVTAAGAAAGASALTPTELIKGDPVLHAMHRASRQLAKLRETLLKQ
ncbi:unnamed protein product, partial [Laminaria digitata]